MMVTHRPQTTTHCSFATNANECISHRLSLLTPSGLASSGASRIPFVRLAQPEFERSRIRAIKDREAHNAYTNIYTRCDSIERAALLHIPVNISIYLPLFAEMRGRLVVRQKITDTAIQAIRFVPLSVSLPICLSRFLAGSSENGYRAPAYGALT